MTVLRRRTRSFDHGEPEPLDFREMHLSRANLSGADLSQANLDGANLTETDLVGADIAEANLFGADLSGARLYYPGAPPWAEDLSEASGASPWEATWGEADLRGADLREADLSGVRYVTQEQLEKAIGDESTKLPPGLKPPAHWGVNTDEQIKED
jgi:uncharacterized protein YjbI with pentapeptide repeats